MGVNDTRVSERAGALPRVWLWSRVWLRPQARLWLGLVALLGFTPSCALFNRLDVESVATGQAPPSQVAAYVTVEQGGESIKGLTAANFLVFEDEQDVTQEARVTLIPKAKVAYHHSVVLVDVGSGAENVQMAGPLRELVTRLRQTRDVSVFGFDGAEDLVALGQYRTGTTDAAGLDKLERLAPRDPSRNLNGAILLGLEQLESRLMQAQRPVRRGSLLVITRGPDLARRVSEDQLLDKLSNTGHQTYSVVLGQHEGLRADDLGATDAVQTDTVSELPTAASRIARLMESRVEAEYVVSYCSPARAGKRLVRIETLLTLEDTEYRGSVDFEIDAAGFTAGCDSSRAPSFLSVVSAANAAPPPPPPPPPAPGDSQPTPDAGKAQPKPAPDGIVPPPSTPDYETP